MRIINFTYGISVKNIALEGFEWANYNKKGIATIKLQAKECYSYIELVVKYIKRE